MKYILQRKDGDEFISDFDNAPAAMAFAIRITKEEGQDCEFELFDSRPAEERDRELLEESEACMDVDFEKDDWLSMGFVIPRNIVLTFKVHYHEA